jgi:type IV pilus assembly protein PilE
MTSTHSRTTTRQFQQGFTLLELMTVVAIVAILAVIALPRYQLYVLRGQQAQAQSDAMRVSNLLASWRARNLSYRNFDLTVQKQIDQTVTGSVSSGMMYVPVGSVATNYKYIMTVVDLDNAENLLTSATATGRNFAIRLERNPSFPQLKNMLMTSTGVRCMSANAISDAAFTTYTGCGTGAISW